MGEQRERIGCVLCGQYSVRRPDYRGRPHAEQGGMTVADYVPPLPDTWCCFKCRELKDRVRWSADGKSYCIDCWPGARSEWLMLAGAAVPVWMRWGRGYRA